MGVNKVEYGGIVLIDLTGDTVTEDTLTKGITAHNAKGEQIVGTHECSGGGSGGLPDTIVAGDTPILGAFGGKNITTTSGTDTGLSVTIPKDGTYRFYIMATQKSTYSYGTGTPTVYLYKNGSSAASGSVASTQTSPVSVDLACSAGDVVQVYGKAVSSGYTTIGVMVQALVVCIDA